MIILRNNLKLLNLEKRKRDKTRTSDCWRYFTKKGQSAIVEQNICNWWKKI